MGERLFAAIAFPAECRPQPRRPTSRADLHISAVAEQKMRENTSILVDVMF